MILNKEKTNIKNSTESKPIKVNKDISRNRKGNKRLLRTHKDKSADIQIKNTNDNTQSIFSIEEPKTKELIFQHLQKVKNSTNYKNFYHNYRYSYKNSIEEGLTDSENATVVYKAPLKKSNQKELIEVKKNSDNKENTDKNVKKNNIKYTYYKNIENNYDNDEPIKIKNEITSQKNNNKIKKYKKSNNSDTNNNMSNTYYKYQTNNEESTIKKYINDNDDNLSNINYNSNNHKIIERNNIDNYFNCYGLCNFNLYRTNNNTLDSNDYYSIHNSSIRNNNQSTTDKIICKITKKMNIPKPLSYRKKPLNGIDDHKTKTLNSFYIKKKQSAHSVNEDINTYNNQISDFNDTNLKTNENNNNNMDNTNISLYNKRNNKKKVNNKIRLLNSGKAISFVESENEDLIDKFNVESNDNENKTNYMTLNSELAENNLNKYCFLKSLQTMSTNNLIKNKSNINKSMKYFSQQNLNKKNNCNDNELSKDDLLSDRNNHFKNKFNNSGIFNQNILFKKKPMNEIRIKNDSYKKFQNLKYIEEKIKKKKKPKIIQKKKL